MSDERIASLLSEAFGTGQAPGSPTARTQHRLVFWNDAEAAYADQITTLVPAGVTLIRVDQEPALSIKHRLEIDEPTTRFLLYAATPEPTYEADWLLDIRLYSKTFRADLASAHLDELGLTNAALHPHLALRRPFLKSKARLAKLRQLVQPGDQEADLDLKMLAVLTESDGSDLDSVVRAMAHGWAPPAGSSGTGDVPILDLEAANPTWEQVAKLELAPAFWTAVQVRFGYHAERPTLADLLTRLLVTDWAAACAAHDGSDVPTGVKHLVLPRRTLWTNVAVLCSHWRSHQRRHGIYQAVSDQVAKRLNLDRHLDSGAWQTLLRVQTFEVIEQLVVHQIRERLCSIKGPSELTAIRDPIAVRRDGFWAGRQLYLDIYQAFRSAEAFLTLRWTYDHGFAASSLEALMVAYTTDLHRFDLTYRHFMAAADAVEATGKDILKPLRAQIEELYVGWYLTHLAEAWDAQVAKDGFLETGRIGHTAQQWRFFAHHVAPLLKQNSRMRVFVVISDALRYEVATEIAASINAEDGLVADLNPMISVLPSYTKLGMAALLPHQELRYTSDADQVLVDGASSGGLAPRQAILKKYQGMAVSAADLIGMKTLDAREATKDARVVYVYHDRIDATGDKRATEGATFKAAGDTITELASLIRFILKNCNTTNLILTADHGFLYQDGALDASDKDGVGEQPEGTLVGKKRFIIGRGLGERPGTWHGSTKTSAGMPAEGALEFWLPKGANRFHLVGGARFVHGGLMPQELLVPLLTVKKKGGDQDTGQVRRVGISLLGQVNRVVNSRQRFEFIQTDPIGDKVRPRTVTVCLHDADQGDKPISDQITISLDSASTNVNDLRKTILLTVAAGVSGKRPNAALVVRDAETQVEIHRFPMIVDIAFSADF